MTAANEIDPIERVRAWLGEVERAGVPEPSAMVLATAVDGAPSARVVLLRGLDARGFVFYTNFGSRKVKEMDRAPRAALCFYWEALGRQVRVEGRVERISDEESDRYWAGRPRDSQLGAWASRQSEALPSRATLEDRMAEVTRRFDGRAVPRPPFWGGYRVAPDLIGFWQRGAGRLHDRDAYRRAGDGWAASKLYP